MKITLKRHGLSNLTMLLFMMSLSSAKLCKKCNATCVISENYEMTLCNYMKGVSCDKYM